MMVDESFYRDAEGNKYHFSDGYNNLSVNGRPVMIAFVGRNERREFHVQYFPHASDSKNVVSGKLEEISDEDLKSP